MGLTREELQKLSAPLPLESGHEVRVQQELQGGSRAMWLVYTTEQPVRERLTEVDPNWSLRHVSEIATANYVAVTVELTVCGVTRTGTGGRDGNSKDTALGAATDALKRAARNFEIGAYLLDTATIYTDWMAKPDPKKATSEDWSKHRKVTSDAEKDAFNQFSKWYRQHFGGKPSAPASQPDPSRAIGRDVPVTPIAKKPTARPPLEAPVAPEVESIMNEMPPAAVEAMIDPVIERARRTFPFNAEDKMIPWQDYMKTHKSWNQVIWAAIKGTLGLDEPATHNGLGVNSLKECDGLTGALWVKIVRLAPPEQQELPIAS